MSINNKLYGYKLNFSNFVFHISMQTNYKKGGKRLFFCFSFFGRRVHTHIPKPVVFSFHFVRNTWNDRQLIGLMEISSLCGSHRAALIAWFPGQGALWLYGSFIILLRFIAVPKSCFGFWSFIFTASVWLPWLTRFYTSRRINVFLMLLFNFQVTF